MELYGLKNCDSCRKALKTLETATLIDVRADGVPEAILAKALEVFGEKLVNTRSTTWRQLDAAERARAPLDLLKELPTLMKRPLIVRDGEFFLGWTKTVQDALAG